LIDARAGLTLLTPSHSLYTITADLIAHLEAW
jgi:hypothetical protein